MKKDIQSLLGTIEQQNQVEVLYACESGSRMWGFESTDSDYDIRFIYRCKPEWYLDIFERTDTIDSIRQSFEGVPLDFSGWEMSKALRLYYKRNPTIFEWLQSSEIYKESTTFAQELRNVSPTFYSRKASFYHYFHMARNNYREFLQGDRVKLKKYLYVVRPILACIYIKEDRGIPPVNFFELVNETLPDGGLKDDILELVRRKKAGEELQIGPRIPSISNFLTEKFEQFRKEKPKDLFSHKVKQGRRQEQERETLNGIFRRYATIKMFHVATVKKGE